MIIVDSREPKHLSTSLKKRKCKVEVKELGIGDYLLDDEIIIERKEGNDFISSMTSGRLKEQLKQMQQYKHPMVCIVENNLWKYFYFCRGKYMHKSYYGMIASIVVNYGIPVIPFRDEDDFLRFMERLEHRQKTHTSRKITEHMRTPKTIYERQENALACAEGVSIDKAKIILSEFGSIANITTGYQDDIMKKLESIKGIGKKTALNVYNLLRGYYSSK